MSERTREVTGWVMPDEVTGDGWGNYLLVVRKDGEMRMIHTEGVAYSVTEDKPWTWTDYAPCKEWTKEELLSLTTRCEEANLADWVRSFGSRLESNFYQIVRWYKS